MAIIKKGSYRWNDVLTEIFPNIDHGYELFERINFYFDDEFYLSDSDIAAIQAISEELELTFLIPQESGTYKARVNCSAIWSLSPDSYSYIVGDVECGEYNELFTFLYYAYSRDGRFDVYSETWENIQYQTVTVTEDAEVSSEFYEWFVENTKTVIKAGTYRFNDVLERIRVAQSLNFYIPFSFALNDNGSIIKEDTPLYCVAFDWKTLEILQYATVESESIWAYGGSEEDGYSWDIMWAIVSDILGTEAPDFLKGYGQTITLETDQTVEADFYEWFNDNAKPVLKKFTRLYIGNAVATSGTRVFKKLTTEEPSAEIADLTGTTWYVPSGWSATAGYGRFNISGTFVYNFATYSFTELRIGWTNGNSQNHNYFWTNDRHFNDVGIGGGSQTPSLEFTFTGGTDATNADLISWLYANGELQ